MEQPKLNTTATQQVVNNYTTIDQTTPSVVPNEPQETLVNAHEEKGKPNNTASNEEVQPGVSNEEVTIESEDFFDAEDDGVTQPRSLTTDMVVEQVDIPNKPNTISSAK